MNMTVETIKDNAIDEMELNMNVLKKFFVEHKYDLALSMKRDSKLYASAYFAAGIISFAEYETYNNNLEKLFDEYMFKYI